ncbi:hypothetical protein N2152v2_008672 [Parachlorella kessleri]
MTYASTLGSEPQAVILAGGGGSRLYPLNSQGMPKVLMPVANRPLLTFPLRMLEEGGIKDVIVVCEGEAAAASVRSWLAHYEGSLHLEVRAVTEGAPTLEALRQVADRIRTEHFVLLSGDVVTEVCLQALILRHHVTNAAVTALLARRRVSAASETKPGKPPRNVDYVGLGPSDRLVFYAHSPDTLRDLRVPQSIIARLPQVQVVTILVDMQVYVFRTSLLRAVLEARPDLQHVEEHLLPFLVRHQMNPPRQLRPASCPTPSIASTSAMSLPSLEANVEAAAAEYLDGAGAASFLGGGGAPASCNGEWYCGAYIAPEGTYCQRANSLQGYADVNREIITPEFAPKLLREQPNPKYDNYVHGTVQTGGKTTVGAGCMIGRDTSLGDKCSVKRSVIGAGCRVGSNVKIINSVLLDGCVVRDNCHIQNSIICAGCELQERVSLKDCQVGPSYVVGEGGDFKGEVLAKK